MTDYEILQKITGEKDEALITVLLDEAEAFVLAYTNRKEMIPELMKPARDLAIVFYNRIGTEGESGRSEAGESYTFEDAPKQIYDVLNRYRLARVGGKVHEFKQTNEA